MSTPVLLVLMMAYYLRGPSPHASVYIIKGGLGLGKLMQKGPTSHRWVETRRLKKDATEVCSGLGN